MAVHTDAGVQETKTRAGSAYRNVSCDTVWYKWRKEKKLKIITDRAAMIYTPVAHQFCLFRGKEKFGRFVASTLLT
jgi:hypothetical protein